MRMNHQSGDVAPLSHSKAIGSSKEGDKVSHTLLW